MVCVALFGVPEETDRRLIVYTQPFNVYFHERLLLTNESGSSINTRDVRDYAWSWCRTR